MIVDMHVQGTPEWFNARRGVPSASNFSRIMTQKTCKLSAQAEEYICELIGDVMGTLLPPWVENYTNSAIRWGEQTEGEARAFYAMERNVDVQQVGFCTTDDGRFGASPDGLVGEDGGLELKCPLPRTHTAYLLSAKLHGPSVPDDYKPQVHGALIVTGRKWWDFMSYCPGMDPLIVRTEPDAYTEKLRAALEEFYPRYMKALAAIRQPEEAAAF